METKICRICGKLSRSHVNIFRTEGLKNKIETCLPIVVSPHILLPDTICTECLENVENFFAFIKNCLQNIIILEAEYDVHESCLKTKRKFDKGCSVSLEPCCEDKNVQTDYLDILTVTNDGCDEWMPKKVAEVLRETQSHSLVDYVVETESEEDEGGKVVINGINRYIDKLLDGKSKPLYFDDPENHLISEIAQRKRKCDFIEAQPPKIFKMDCSSNRRKSKQPKKVAVEEAPPSPEVQALLLQMPQTCLLCESQFPGVAALAAHVFEVHGIDMAEVVAQNNDEEKKKKIPELVKISDLRKDSVDLDTEEPPTLLPSFVCPTCPAMFTNRSELFVHLRLKHPDTSSLLCGICLNQATSYLSLQAHVETCSKTHPTTCLYTCQICFYGDNNFKLVENHVLVHEFLIDNCKKLFTMFDPADYVKSSDNSPKSWFCNDCNSDDFSSFKSFSTHMRSQHSKFYCDLCSKYYGRNSHLWKHVNRLHKGHPSITCQICYKTSASKYHLQQHFNKIHSQKNSKQKNDDQDFMSQKFQAFDFQSVKQSFMRQDLLEQQKNGTNDLEEDVEGDEEGETPEAPKEIDSSSNLYTNIITNYTPPVNIGDYKCPKCGKGFQKKPLLKKHKKNCRPRLQKDLLTRCKSCARIFKDRQSLSKHLDNYHSEYACEICQQKVQSKCEIVSHIRFTHPNCHLICKICGNILRSKDDLDAHVQNHADSFICQFCADSIPSKIKLKMHILSLHRKILSLSCGICLKLFETQHILRDHVKLVHKDDLSPLTSCTVCGKNYGSKWKTFDHLNKSHGRIFKACRVCLEVFDDLGQLEAHAEEVHVNKSVPSKVAEKPKQEFKVEKVEKVESESEEVEENFESSDEEDQKMSLLEKRLAGEDVVKVKKEGSNASKRTVYVNSNDPSHCEICFKHWPAKKHLWQHYIRCHKVVAATVCGICLKTNRDYRSLQEHLQENHPTLLYGRGFGSNFICRICGRYHNASSKLKLHMTIHENFDWSILEEAPVKESNGFMTPKIEPEEESINYDDDIEQIECSSVELDMDPIKDERESTSTDEDDSDSSDNESESEESTDFTEELDSAIKSISYNCVQQTNNDIMDDYCDIQPPILNENELESAVGSIL